MTNQESFLIEEYNAASKLTFHIDELRNKLTSFFISFATIITGLITLFLEGKILNEEINEYNYLSFIMVFISLIGFIMVCILGKLRKVQFEHFNIINNIRTHFLHSESKYTDIVILNNNTLPNEKYSSGSYLWTLMIILCSSAIFSISVCFLFYDGDFNSNWINLGIVFFSFVAITNLFYYYLSYYNYQNYNP